jgi:hypothetical protein
MNKAVICKNTCPGVYFLWPAGLSRKWKQNRGHFFTNNIFYKCTTGDASSQIKSDMNEEVSPSSLSTMYPEKIISSVCEGAIRNFFGENGYFDIPQEDIPKQKQEIIEQLKGWQLPSFNTPEDMIKAEKEDYENRDRDWNKCREMYVSYEISQTEDMKYTYGCTNDIL